MYKFKLRFGKNVPHIQWDGIVDAKNPTKVLCIKNNKNVSFANLDVANNFKNVSRDATVHDCSLESLKMAKID